MKSKQEIGILCRILELRFKKEAMPRDQMIAIGATIQILHYVLELPLFEEEIFNKGETEKLYKQMDDNILKYRLENNIPTSVPDNAV